MKINYFRNYQNVKLLHVQTWYILIKTKISTLVYVHKKSDMLSFFVGIKLLRGLKKISTLVYVHKIMIFYRFSSGSNSSGVKNVVHVM